VAVPVHAGVAGYLEHVVVEKGLSANTVAAYRRDLDRFEVWLAEAGIDDLAAVTAAQLGDFVTWASRDGGLSASSVRRTVSSVRGLFTYLGAEGLIDIDPTEDVSSPTIPTRLPKALSVHDTVAMVESCDPTSILGIRDRALLEFLYGSGARISEAVDMTGDALDLETRSVLLRGKGGKQRRVPIGSYAATAVQAYLVRSRPALLAKRRRGGRHARSSSTCAAASCRGRVRTGSCQRRQRGLGSRRCLRTLCGTPSRPTCSRGVRMCESSRSCSGTHR
jgi:integrase/recombinase XerD